MHEGASVAVEHARIVSNAPIHAYAATNVLVNIDQFSVLQDAAAVVFPESIPSAGYVHSGT